MKVYQNIFLKNYLWFKIGGKASLVIDIPSKEDLIETLHFIKENKIQNIFVLGEGSNLLFRDELFDGAILHFTEPNPSSIKLVEDETIECFAGESLDSVIRFAFDNNLVGLEWAGGLPGTVGAAVRGNVGAFGGEIKDTFQKAHGFRLLTDENYEELSLDNSEMEFAYRTSRVKREKLIVVSSLFKLKKGDKEEVEKAKEVYYANINYRNEKHPLEYPNCGSVFKNISKPDEVEKVISVWPDIKSLVDTKWHGKVSMGYIIDRLGLKGFRVGNAQVSEKHQNFIINLGEATSHDVKKIITTIEKKVQDTFGFTPEVEIEIV